MNEVQDSLIREISKEVIQEIMPEEIFIFDDTYEFVRASGYKMRDDRFLGSDLVPTFTPVVIEVVNFVLRNLGKEGILTKLFSKKKKEISPLTREQLEIVRKNAEKQALSFGIGERKAKQLANAITGSIASKKL